MQQYLIRSLNIDIFYSIFLIREDDSLERAEDMKKLLDGIKIYKTIFTQITIQIII
jgi:hypothetical protein